MKPAFWNQLTRWEVPLLLKQKKFSSHHDFRQQLENINSGGPRTRTQINRTSCLSFWNHLILGGSAPALNTWEWWHWGTYWHLKQAPVPGPESTQGFRGEAPHSMRQCRCHDKYTCHFHRDTSLQYLVFFPAVQFHCAKEPKSKKQENHHTSGLEGKAADWSCDLACEWKKCKACYYVSRNPFWKENRSAFISVVIHSKECTHFVLLSQHLIIDMQNNVWFCHQMGNFVVWLFLLKQMIAANSAKAG